MCDRSKTTIHDDTTSCSLYALRFTALSEVPGAAQFLTESSGAPMTSSSASLASTAEYIGTLPNSADRINGHCLCGQTRTSLPGAALKSFLVRYIPWIDMDRRRHPHCLNQIACHCGDCQHFTGTSNSILISLLQRAVTIEGPLRKAKGSVRHTMLMTFHVSC